MSESTNITQTLDQIYKILDKDYFHVCVEYTSKEKIEWKIYFKNLTQKDYFSEENKCLLSSDKITLEDNQ